MNLEKSVSEIGNKTKDASLWLMFKIDFAFLLTEFGIKLEVK